MTMNISARRSVPTALLLIACATALSFAGIEPPAALEVQEGGIWEPATRIVAWGSNTSGQLNVPENLHGVVSVAPGDQFTMALKSDGHVVVWGDDSYGQKQVPAGLSDVVAIAAGRGHLVALKRDGTVVAWGDNYYQQTNVPANLSGVVAIAANGFHTVALKNDGTVVVWGRDNFLQTTVPPGLKNVVAIAAGGYGASALKSDGKVVTWGYTGGPLPADLSGVVALAESYNGISALKNDGTVVTRGYDIGLPEDTHDVVAIASGLSRLVALKSDGTVVTSTEPTPAGQSMMPADLGNVMGIGASHYTVAALTRAIGFPQPSPGVESVQRVRVTNTGSVPLNGLIARIMGAEPGESDLIRLDQTTILQPGASLELSIRYAPKSNPQSKVRLEIGTWTSFPESHIEAYDPWIEAELYVRPGAKLGLLDAAMRPVSTEDHLIGWGDNSEGQSRQPARLHDVVAVSAGYAHTVALQRDGKVLAWGRNSEGQINVPEPLLDCISVVAGDYHTLALRRSGTVVAFGSNQSGQIGVPAGLWDVEAIAAGETYSVALKKYGSVVSWGRNPLATIALPRGLSNVVAIDNGSNHTLALKSDGSVTAWGWNSEGQCNVPAGLYDLVAISAGGTNSLALKRDGTVVAWGKDYYGVPTPPAGLDHVVAIAAGYAHNAALKRDGSVVAWGYSEYGQLGVPPGLTGVKALAAGGFHTVAVVEPSGSFARPAGQAKELHLFIENQGTLPLTNLHAEIEGPDAKQFAIASGLPSAVAVDMKLPLTVSFNSTRTGPATAFLKVYSNDPASPFILPLTALGTLTAVDLRLIGSDGQPEPDQAATINVDDLGIGGSVERTFILHNYGQTLTNLSLAFAEADANGLAIVHNLPRSLASGESATFTLRLTSTRLGNRSVTVQLLSNELLAPLTQFTFDFYLPDLSTKLALLDAAGTDAASPYETNVIAWGDNFAGQTTVPKDLHNVTAIAAGAMHSMAIRADGTVAAWGANYTHQTDVPPGLHDVTALAGGNGHSIAVKGDGSVVAWGEAYVGTPASVPAGLSSVMGVAAGAGHTLALKFNGTVVAWGDNEWNQSKVPAGLSSVIQIAAANGQSWALRSNGTVAMWGYGGYFDPRVTASLRNVTAISAGDSHTLALKSDGTVFAWGDKVFSQSEVPAGITGVASIAAGGAHSVVLKSDGTIFTWGLDRIVLPPTGLSGVLAIAAGGTHTLAIVETGNHFGSRLLGSSWSHNLFLKNVGTADVTLSGTVMEGPDASQFQITVPVQVATGTQRPVLVEFKPSRVGPVEATIKIASGGSAPPLMIPLHGFGNFSLTGTKPGVKDSHLTCGPLTLDKLTGLLVQKVTFINTTGITLNGLRLTLSKVVPGLQVYGSSLGSKPSTLEVLYTNPVFAGATATFNLVYFDASRRSAATITPLIQCEALTSPEPQPGPVSGTLIKVLAVRDTPQGPMLEWNTLRNAGYVVEYSDDAGKTWSSAVHRLGTASTRMIWIDRGQPETQTKPLNKAARTYRVKKL